MILLEEKKKKDIYRYMKFTKRKKKEKNLLNIVLLMRFSISFLFPRSLKKLVSIVFKIL